jgi:nucleotide-binding universal stress UspA family protein
MQMNILVYIPCERPAGPAIDGAVSLATSQNALIDAISIGYEAANVGFVVDAGAAMAAIYDAERERALERANAALAEFGTKASAAGVPFNCRALTAFPGDAFEIVGAAARLHDLTVAIQPEPDSDSFDNAMAQEILFRSGAPLLVLPYTHKGPCALKRIGIAWDGSRTAARALRDAIPLLRAADTIDILSVNDDERSEETTATAVQAYLARHEFAANVQRLIASHGDIQPTLLSTASDLGLDLMVMGGYGHSRLREGLLGGVTRAMFESMTVPTLMSH